MFEKNRIILCGFADEADKNLDGQIKVLRENNIEYMEIRNVNGINISEISMPRIKEIKSSLESSGIKVWSIGSPVGKAPIDEDFSLQTEIFKHILNIAHELEAECIRIFSFYKTNGDPIYHDTVMERLMKFSELAEGSGVMLCHENEKGIYGDIASRCLEIHRALPSIKAVFDPANFIQCGENTLKAWAMLKPYVHYGHIKDATAEGKIVPAGMGIGNIEKYIPDFIKSGSHVLSIEPHLIDFCGLKALESNGEKSEIGLLHFTNGREAFTYAVNALKKILENNNILF